MTETVLFWTRGYADVWVPDKEFVEQYKRPVMFPNEETSQWKLPPFNRKSYFFVRINYLS